MEAFARKTRISVLAAVVLVLGALTAVVAQEPGSATSPPSVQPTQLPLPAGGTSPRINAVNCGGAGFCVAVGFYQNGSTLQGLIETLSGGQWTASTSPVPPGAPGGGALAGVSCTGTTCAAWGQYATGPSTSAYMAAVLTGGTWSAAAISPPSGGTFPGAPYGNAGPITGAGCFGPGACVLVGNYVTGDNHHQGWVAAYSSNAWQPALMTAVPPDTTGQGSSLAAVSCGNGLCQAVGEYVNTNGFQSLEVSINPGGAMNSPFAGALPGTATQSDGGLLGVGCDAGGLCTGYGAYRTSGGSNSEAYVVPIGGTAFQPQQPLTPTPQSTTSFPAAHLLGVGCAGGDCVVTGYYVDTAATFHPLIDRFTGGHWVADTVPAGTNPTPVACGAPSFCLALDTTTPGTPADVFTGSTWATLSLTMPSGATSNVADYATSPLACDSGSSCWVVGDFGTASGTEAFADLVTTGSAPGPTPTPTPTAGGGAATPAQVAGWFHGALVPAGAAAHIAKILHAHGFSVTVTAGEAGSVRVVWTAVVSAGHRKKKVVIAVGSASLAGGRSATIKVLLTPAGKRLLAKAHQVPILTGLVFTPTSGQAISLAGHGVLRH